MQVKGFKADLSAPRVVNVDIGQDLTDVIKNLDRQFADWEHNINGIIVKNDHVLLHLSVDNENILKYEILNYNSSKKQQNRTSPCN